MIPLKDYPNVNRTFGPMMLILLFVGMGLLVAAMVIYDDVAMPLYIALLLWVAPGVLLTPVLYKSYTFTKLKGILKVLTVFLINILSFGSILLYVVLATDYYGADGKIITTGNYNVIETGSGPSRYHREEIIVDAAIIYKNHKKWFRFGYNLGNDTLNYHKIQLVSTAGKLGYDVIKSYKMVK